LRSRPSDQPSLPPFSDDRDANGARRNARTVDSNRLEYPTVDRGDGHRWRDRCTFLDGESELAPAGQMARRARSPNLRPLPGLPSRAPDQSVTHLLPVTLLCELRFHSRRPESYLVWNADSGL